jgi:hypothetical protein
MLNKHVQHPALVDVERNRRGHGAIFRNNEWCLMRFVLFLFIGAMFVGGCTTMSPGTDEAGMSPSRVTVAVSESQVEDCTFLTELTVEPPFALLTQSYPETAFMMREDVRRELRRETAQSGGDTVVPTQLENGEVQAKTYACAPQG